MTKYMPTTMSSSTLGNIGSTSKVNNLYIYGDSKKSPILAIYNFSDNQNISREHWKCIENYTPVLIKLAGSVMLEANIIVKHSSKGGQ